MTQVPRPGHVFIDANRTVKVKVNCNCNQRSMYSWLGCASSAASALCHAQRQQIKKGRNIGGKNDPDPDDKINLLLKNPKKIIMEDSEESHDSRRK
jgi:hypothetical protein